MTVWRYPELQDYQVSLPEYQGPLAVLLDLIEQARLDITRLALAQITDQFLAHVRAMEARSPEQISAFLVVAARLLYIKTQALLPAPPAPRQDEEDDPGETLVLQLQAYRRFRNAARWLQARMEAGRVCYPSGFSTPTPTTAPVSLPGQPLEPLVRMARRLLRPEPPQPVPLQRPRISVRERIQALLTALRRKKRLSFFQWVRLQKRPGRDFLTASFLALLELLKQRRARAEQARPFEDIWITLHEEERL